MKKLTRTFALILLSAALPALAVVMPMRIPFQGKLIDPVTNNPKNGAVAMIFKIWNAPTGGVQLFTESQTVNVVNGVFSVQIGTISYLSADMLSGTSAYLGVAAGGDPEMVPRQPLSMSPYAYTALQLATDQNIRINAGITYSTFTTAGNLALQYGVVGTTASFSVVTATGTGGNASVVASSSIVMSDGYLKIAAASKGIDASGTGITATTATFANITSTGVGTFGIVTSSGINMLLGTMKIDAASRGIDATGTGIVASSATFNTVVLATQAAVVSITVTNTLIDVSNISFLKLTSNNATSTNRIFCLGKARPGHILVIKWDTNAGTNEGQLNDGLSNLGSCTSANSAMPAALSAVWPATTLQVDDTITLIFAGSEWTELSRSAN